MTDRLTQLLAKVRAISHSLLARDDAGNRGVEFTLTDAQAIAELRARDIEVAQSIVRRFAGLWRGAEMAGVVIKLKHELTDGTFRLDTDDEGGEDG